MYRVLILLLVLARPVQADRLVASYTIPAHSIIDASDLRLEPDPASVALDPELVIGQETTITLYSGKPIRLDDLRAPARVRRRESDVPRRELSRAQVRTCGGGGHRCARVHVAAVRENRSQNSGT